jgi:hypothetical protein
MPTKEASLQTCADQYNHTDTRNNVDLVETPSRKAGQAVPRGDGISRNYNPFSF